MESQFSLFRSSERKCERGSWLSLNTPVGFISHYVHWFFVFSLSISSLPKRACPRKFYFVLFALNHFSSLASHLIFSFLAFWERALTSVPEPIADMSPAKTIGLTPYHHLKLKVLQTVDYKKVVLDLTFGMRPRCRFLLPFLSTLTVKLRTA